MKDFRPLNLEALFLERVYRYDFLDVFRKKSGSKYKRRDFFVVFLPARPSVLLCSEVLRNFYGKGLRESLIKLLVYPSTLKSLTESDKKTG